MTSKTMVAKIGLFAEEVGDHVTDAWLGVAQYGSTARRWCMHVTHEIGELLSRDNRFEALIGFWLPEHLSELRAFPGELVNLSPELDTDQLPGMPTVGVDYAAIGETAANYFLDKGFRALALCSYHHTGILGALRYSFIRTAGLRGVAVEVYDRLCPSYPPARIPEHARVFSRRTLVDWVMQLPKPIGILCNRDSRAMRVLGICEAMGVGVPEQVSVLGIGDDRTFRHFSRPSLSSVAIPSQRIGFEAARLLDSMLCHRKPRPRPLLLRPRGIITRQSTDAYCVDDPLIAEVMRYVHVHAREGIGLPDLLREFPVSRAALMQRFKKAANRSPYQAILRERLEHAKGMLIRDEESLEGVAAASGFSSAVRMARALKRQIGVSPGRFRRLNRDLPR